MYYSHTNPVWLLRLTFSLYVFFGGGEGGSDSDFISTKPHNSEQYSIQFLKFIKRILLKFPITTPEGTFKSKAHAETQELLDFIEPALCLIKKTIRFYFTASESN